MPAEVERQRTLRERAELALERADVRVVDVAVAHEGHDVADDLAPQLVGHLGDPRDLGPACAEQGDDLVEPDLLAGEHARRAPHRPRLPARCRRRRREQRRRIHVAAREPSGRRGRGPRCRRRRAPRCARPGASQRSGSRDVLRVDGQPRGEHLARGLGRGAQPLELGPRPFRVHVVGGDGRDAAPVVDAGGERARRGRR